MDSVVSLAGAAEAQGSARTPAGKDLSKGVDDAGCVVAAWPGMAAGPLPYPTTGVCVKAYKSSLFTCFYPISAVFKRAMPGSEPARCACSGGFRTDAQPARVEKKRRASRPGAPGCRQDLCLLGRESSR